MARAKSSVHNQQTKEQSRSRETQDKIITAAIKLLSRHGVSGVTHRSVAEEAGVSLALTTYHFDSKETLLRKAYQKLHHDEVDRFNEIYRTQDAPKLSKDEIIDHISTQVIREATEFKEQAVAGCELMIEAFRSKELHGAARKVYDEKSKFWAETMQTLGAEDADLDGQIMLCSTLGNFLALMARGKTGVELSKTRKRIQDDFDALLPGGLRIIGRPCS